MKQPNNMKLKTSIVIGLFTVTLFNCKKKEEAVTLTPSVTATANSRDKFIGNYNVKDTTTFGISTPLVTNQIYVISTYANDTTKVNLSIDGKSFYANVSSNVLVVPTQTYSGGGGTNSINGQIIYVNGTTIKHSYTIYAGIYGTSKGIGTRF